ELEEAGAGQSGERWREGDADRDHADRDPRREHGGEEQRGEDRGEPLHRVDQAHEGLVAPAPRVPAQHPHEDAGGAAEAHRDDATNRVTPCTTGRSRAVIAPSANRPRPGSANTDSRTIEPAMSWPSWIPATVTIGISAFRSVCFPSTNTSLTPFARAVRTYSSRRT